MLRFRFLSASVLIVALLAACGGGGGGSTPVPVVTSSPAVNAAVGTLVIAATPQTAGNATGPWLIVASVVDKNSQPMPNVAVTLNVTQGQISPSQGQTDVAGGFAATLTPPAGVPVVGVAASAGNQKAVVDVVFQNLPAPASRSRNPRPSAIETLSPINFGTGISTPNLSSFPAWTDPTLCLNANFNNTTGCSQTLAKYNMQVSATDTLNAICDDVKLVGNLAGAGSCIGTAVVMTACIVGAGATAGVAAALCAGTIGFLNAASTLCLEFATQVVAENLEKNYGVTNAVLGLDTVKFIADPKGGAQAVLCDVVQPLLKPSPSPTPGSGGGGGGGAGGGGTPTSTTVTVDLTQPWATDTLLSVSAGQQVSITASGTIKWGGNASDPGGGTATPDGFPWSACVDFNNTIAQFTAPNLACWSLIGKIGVNGTPFEVGSSLNNYTVPTSGELYLGINDDVYTDNSGSWTANITVTSSTVTSSLAAPSNLSLVMDSGGAGIGVSWSDNSNNEAGFDISYSPTQDAGTAKHMRVGPNQTSLSSDWGLTSNNGLLVPGQVMCYQVTAFNSTGTSAPTPWGCITVPPPTTGIAR
jgi:hypothetical protein